MTPNITDVIYRKRNGLELTSDEINAFIKGVVGGTINEAQTGAMLMAMFLHNLSYREIVALTKAMAESGEIFSLNGFGTEDDLVDKHSTGGVGDKVSLILAPALGALGLKVPMMSGWSLDHTGGTLDKLQSVPGFQVSLSLDQMKNCLRSAGCFICSSSGTFAPADSVLYKLRDLTATVDNRGLIVSSILSKKIAEGIGTLVIDVKYGRGSFQKTMEEAKTLADLIVKIGNELNLKVKAVISEMNAPLGRYVGNALEVEESVRCLRNEVRGDLRDLVKFLGAVILESKGFTKGRVTTLEEGQRLICRTLADGSALNSFRKMLTSQGVTEEDASALCSGRFGEVLPRAPRTTELTCPKSGVVVRIDSLNLGKACRLLATRGDQHDSSAGVVLLKLLGDNVQEKEPWIRVHHSTQVLTTEIEALIKDSLIVEATDTRKTKRMAMILHA